MQPLRCAFVKICRDGGQRVCHHIQLPQRLGQLGDVELEGRFHGVQEYRVLFPAVLSRQRELPAEHPLYQLQQQRLLTGKNMEERTLPNACRLCDLSGCSSGVALFQEQRHRRP